MKYALNFDSMKSGYSAIFPILKQHPEICAAESKLDRKVKNESYLTEKERLRIRELLQNEFQLLKCVYNFDTGQWDL